MLTVALEVVASLGLGPGATLSGEQVTRLELAADREAAYRTAIRLLGHRSYARADLARRLKLKGHPESAVQIALDRAVVNGYLDDARFVRGYVESRAARGRGPARLRRELYQMGVDRGLVEAALAGVEAEPSTSAQIDRLIARRLPAVRALKPATARQRLLLYLARRGFQGEQVRGKVIAALRNS
jgi:regulatory protein